MASTRDSPTHSDQIRNGFQLPRFWTQGTSLGRCSSVTQSLSAAAELLFFLCLQEAASSSSPCSKGSCWVVVA